MKNPSDHPSSNHFLEQIREIFHDNGWDGLLAAEIAEVDPTAGSDGQSVQVRLCAGHRTAPGDVVNVYREGVHPLEQVQQECLRALRTGRPGI